MFFSDAEVAARSDRPAYNNLTISGIDPLVQLPGIGTASSRRPASLSSERGITRLPIESDGGGLMPRKSLDRRRAEPAPSGVVQPFG